eukprot:scaffold1267_cov171-Amphora_coffeaeformis.AAC.24
MRAGLASCLGRVFAVAIIALSTRPNTSPFAKAFGQAPPASLSRPFSGLQESLASATSSESTSCETAIMTNWRLFQDASKESDQAKSLRHREPWSNEAYEHSVALYEKFAACDDTYMAQEIKDALTTLDDALRLYGPTSVICSFNGGKDACVILELVRAAYAKYYQDREGLVPIRPRVVYWDKEDEFPEVIQFVKDNVHKYDLDMIAFDRGISFGDGLKLLVENNMPDENTLVSFPMAFVLGTRSGDPNAGGQAVFSPSSSYMPPFMRVNPIIHWNYGQVWQFLRGFHLPYCQLYEDGYTSLGSCKDTLKNPALYVPGEGDSEGRYREAWMLTDYDLERAGRIPKGKKGDAPSASTHLSTMSRRRVITDKIPSFVGESQDGTDGDFSYASDSPFQRTVGLLVIGDEILKGYTADTNTNTAALVLHNENVVLKRVVIVSDTMEDIVEEISRLQEEVDAVITSGGVGPTHDDITIKSVADALGKAMEYHEDMGQLLREKMGTGLDTELTEAQLKMATLPAGSKLRYLSDDPDDWPVLQCRNIFVLPGVPEFFEKKIADVAGYLSCQLERAPGYKVILSVDENTIVPVLNRVVANHPNVSVGSYPFVNQPDRKTVITLEGRLSCDDRGRSNSVVLDRKMINNPRKTMERYVEHALDELVQALPHHAVLRVDKDDMVLFSYGVLTSSQALDDNVEGVGSLEQTLQPLCSCPVVTGPDPNQTRQDLLPRVIIPRHKHKKRTNER